MRTPYAPAACVWPLPIVNAEMLTGLCSLGMSSQCRDLRTSTRASLIKTVATSLSIPVTLRTISEAR
eukprot:11272213-Heterocapsa_arctica.AAC.1